MRRQTPRILVVTPEVTCLPGKMEPATCAIGARAGGLGDICAAQIQALVERDLDVHLALPNYRNIFNINARSMPGVDIPRPSRQLAGGHVHLAQDRSFFYHQKLFLSPNNGNIRISLAFQREVIHQIVPKVQPDLIHCFDWMTGLIPAMARRIGIPCLFFIYRTESPHLLLSTVEEMGIDAAAFWQHGYFSRMPVNYEETRNTNPIDLLVSGVFAADIAVTLSRAFSDALVNHEAQGGSPALRTELRNKRDAGCLDAVTPSPDASFNPIRDRALFRTYGPETHHVGKPFNKLHLQEVMNLSMDSTAPLLFWPTRLDGCRPGCRLMVEHLEAILERYRRHRMQIVFVAEGDFSQHLRDKIGCLHAEDHAAICDFDSRRYRLAYAGADFVLMPIYLDPCALPCRIGQRYGALPVAYEAGAIRECVSDLDAAAGTGSGFLFRQYNIDCLMQAIDRAMVFFTLPTEHRRHQVQRIMTERLVRFDPDETARQLFHLYERILGRAVVNAPEQNRAAEVPDIAA